MMQPRLSQILTVLVRSLLATIQSKYLPQRLGNETERRLA